MRKKLKYYLVGIFFLLIALYFVTGFYIANSILYIDNSKGLHQDSLPNTWSTKTDHHEYKIISRSELRKNFLSTKYHLNEWQEVYFSSREKDIKISGWLFNYYLDRPIVIIIHGIFPNGKCKPESNLIASLLIKNKINALTIDLRNYGQSSKNSKYENLGLTEYKDVLGAFDFLKSIGFKENQIGIHGISLGATSAIFAAEKESAIQAIWLDSSLAEFSMILKDEIKRYGMPHDFGPAVSFAGRVLTGIDPTKLSPVFSLTRNQNYFFTHGDKDLRIPLHHYKFIKEYVDKNKLNADFWLAENSFHVDAMFKYPEEYGKKMKIFFEKNLN